MIKEYRKSRKLTQAQLGEMAGVARSTVAWCERYENEKVSPTIQDLQAFIRHSIAYENIAKAYSRPAIVETKPKLSFFARLWRWLRW